MAQYDTSGATRRSTPLPLEPSAVGICEGCSIMTMDGHLPIEYLVLGDRVITTEGVRVLQTITAAPVAGSSVLVKKHALGRQRPMEDVYLAPQQRINLIDWNNGAHWGSDLGCVPVERLVDGGRIRFPDRAGPPLTYQLDFGTDAVIFVEGLEVPCPTRQRQPAQDAA